MPENPDAIVYQQIGHAGFQTLAANFYKHVLTDDILAPMYPADDMQGSQERLRDFLIFRFGGPQHYIENRGHPRLRARHAPFKIDQPARDRWLSLMQLALTESNLPAPSADILHQFFQNTSTFLINTGNSDPTAGFAGNPHFPVRE